MTKMNFSIVALVMCIVILQDDVFITTAQLPNRIRFIALNDSLHVLKLYQEVRNEDPPSASADPAVSSVRARNLICEDVASSGYFWLRGLIPIDLETLSTMLKRRRNSWNVLFKMLDDGEFANPYREREFKLFGPDRVREYVFLCPVQRWSFNQRLIPFYVSKEYNVGAPGTPYKPGRFVFGNFVPHNPDAFDYLILAEEPAEAYVEPGFNVELHYLRLRKYTKPARSNEFDPLCKMITDELCDTNDQHYRLCVAVFRSAYFRNPNIWYPKQRIFPCYERQISFRTEEAIEEAAGAFYRERMTLCYSAHVDPEKEGSFLYISRAYQSNHVFVYRGDSSSGRIYLENLSANINIVDESYLYEFPEQ